MNDNLTKRITEYLQLDTNYAIIITGDYGIGKTHYLRNILFPKVCELKVSGSEDNFIPVVISLFGVNSIEEIQNQVFLELYPIFKKKGLKIAAGLGNGILKFLTGSELDEVLKNTDTTSGSLVDYGKVLLCIDDLDRKSKDLDLEEVYGFVNNLVENVNAKVLLIANEDELRKEFKDNLDNYSMIREKVIGVSLQYSANVTQVFDEILKLKYKEGNKTYFDFLTSKGSEIIKRIEQNKSNLRNLLFFLEHFKVIYTGVNSRLEKDSYLDSVQDEIYNSILNFSLPLAIEYKLGKLNSETFEGIQGLYKSSVINLSSFMNDRKQLEDDETYSEYFERTYLESSNFRKVYFSSIFTYLTGSSAFDIDQLMLEINASYNIKEQGVPPRERALSNLSYWECIDLSAEEYRSQTKLLLENVDIGAFNLAQYPTVFHYATRFNNILNFSITKLIARFKKGINKGMHSYKFDGGLNMRISADPNSEYYKELLEIISYCNEANDKVKAIHYKEKSDDLFYLFKANFPKFLETIQSNQSEVRFTPFFAEIDFRKFWTEFKKLKNSDIVDFGFYVRSRYRKQIYEEILPEKNFLRTLESELDKRISSKSATKLKKVAFGVLLNQVKIAIQNFPLVS